VPMETAERDLKHLLNQLKAGETIILTSAEGEPLAVLVSVRSKALDVQSVTNWETKWDVLTQKVSQAWHSDKSALETLIEMRR
jgi:prevent-host-death family protein